MTYRIIYSLQLDLEPGPGGELRQLIVPLRRDGTATNIEPEPPRKRAIDLRDGDFFEFHGRRERIVRIKAYRNHCTEVVPAAGGDGYVFHWKVG